MTELFRRAMSHIFEHEGGYNDIKEDRGGATNWGVSLRFLRSQGIDIDGDGDTDWQDIKRLTKDQAEEIYHNYFWKPVYDSIASHAVAMKAFDMAVNMGHPAAHRILQSAANETSNCQPPLKLDGVIGPATKEMINQILMTLNEARLAKEIIKGQMHHYVDIVRRRPDQMIFLKGWTNRAFWWPEQ